MDQTAIMAALLKAVENIGKASPRKSKGKAKSKGKGRTPSTPEEKAARMAANDAECIKVFKAAGYETVEPRFNVKTYGKWAEVGRLVRKGEKAHRVGPFNLFHEDQTDPIVAQPVTTETQATVH
jgi:hypothetical protein